MTLTTSTTSVAVSMPTTARRHRITAIVITGLLLAGSTVALIGATAQAEPAKSPVSSTTVVSVQLPTE